MTKPVKVVGVVALTALAIAVATCFSAGPLVFFRAFVIPSASMEETLQRGDEILARTYPRPKVGRREIVVAISKLKRDEFFVKRVIAIGGDRLHITKSVVYLNGKPQAEPYVKLLDYDTPELDNFPPKTPLPAYARWTADMLEHHVVDGELVIPEGYCFLMGDNRRNSLDDRFTGLTPDSDVIGLALFIYSAGPGTDARRIFKPL